MSTIWKHRINIIVPEGDKEFLNALWTIVAPEGDTEASTFARALSADGLFPSTHRCVSTAATETIADKIIGKLEK